MTALLTPSEVAVRLGRSYDHVLRLIHSGVLRAFDDGAGKIPRWRVSEDDLEAFIEARQSRSATPAGARG